MMKMTIRNISVLFLLLGLNACSGGEEKTTEQIIASGDLEAMNAERDAIKNKEIELAERLESIDKAIAKRDTTDKLPLITVQPIATEEFLHYIELQGDVQTKNNLILYPEYAGVMTHVLVKEGQNVSKGQVLARIADGGLGQQRAQMQLQADLARTTFEKQARLWEKKIGSEMQYLQAKTSYEAQKEALNQMDSQLAKTTIRAPFSGTVDEVITEQGSVVAPGQSPIMRIVGLRDMYVEINVPEVHLTSVKKGKSAVVDIPVIGEEFNSSVRSVANYINPANRTFRVEVAVSDKEGRIRPNLNAKVKLNDYSAEEAILIPQSVISENAEGQEYVYVMRDREGDKATAERVFVTLGLSDGDRIEVKQGLKAGDEIVIEGARAIREGQQVRIIG